MAAKKRPKKRRKADEVRKEESIRIRVSEADKETLSAGAIRDGIPMSSWLVNLGLRRAAETEK
jgi:hypothetical protein